MPAEGLLLTKNSKLVMVGDSITDAGRKQPEGEGLFDALGRGYVQIVEALLTATNPDLCIRIVNKGNSGNTVLDVQKRWKDDVLDIHPDWVSIMIGTNDVWRQFDSPLITESHVAIDVYEYTLNALVEQTIGQVKGMILLTPFYIEPNKDDRMRERMDEYGAAVKRVAERNNTLFVDTQAAFDAIMVHIYPATLAWDRVHPNQAGHAVLAKAFLNAIHFSWDV
jgi:lysophospholipase L1-like esterase